MNSLISENDARLRRLTYPYDPLRGIGCLGHPDSPIPDPPFRRVEVATPVPDYASAWVPETMLDDPAYPTVSANPEAWMRLRCRHDFEFWTAIAVNIRHKLSGENVALRLNHPQRKVLAVFERQRLTDRPIRTIILKARQWGASTLVEAYMAWIQLCLKRNWNSLICAQIKDTATTLRGMYAKIIENYPSFLRDCDGGGDDDAERPLALRPFQHSSNVREIVGRGARVTVASAESQDAVRGGDFSMAHLSETAFWQKSRSRDPLDFIRTIYGSIPLVPYSFVAMESTANGVGNYFHAEWLRSVEGESDKTPIFIPWYDIEIYRVRVRDPEGLFASLSPYEKMLWDSLSLSLEQILWYRMKSREYATRIKMQAEFPTTALEAFVNASSQVFNPEDVEILGKECLEPYARGDVHSDDRLSVDEAAETGPLSVWKEPEDEAYYEVVVDVGGRSESADYSVIAVMRRPDPRSPTEVVAQWRGHVDHDILVDKAMALGRIYNYAQLTVEANTLESARSSGAPGMYILQRLKDEYPNLYFRRTNTGNDTLTGTTRIGFHTNRATKAMIIANLIHAVRDGLYVERDRGAINEYLTYQLSPNGQYAARDGCHDDILMTRAIALHVINTTAPVAISTPSDPYPT